jgi:hypothetical protein
MKKKSVIGLLVVAVLVLAVGGWIVQGGRSLVRPRYA